VILSYWLAEVFGFVSYTAPVKTSHDHFVIVLLLMIMVIGERLHKGVIEHQWGSPVVMAPIVFM